MRRASSRLACFNNAAITGLHPAPPARIPDRPSPSDTHSRSSGRLPHPGRHPLSTRIHRPSSFQTDRRVQPSHAFRSRRGIAATSHVARDTVDQQRGPSEPVPEEILMQYAESPPAYVTLEDLTRFGRPPLSEAALIESAEATRKELPHRLARRVLAHRALPFIVGRNPYIAQVYNLYESSFATLSAVPEIKTLEDNERFSQTLDELVADHSENVPVLARGFSECKDYLTDDEIGTFFDRAVRNRIGIRLTAEQHLALTFFSSGKGKQRGGPSEIGIVDTQCSVAKVIRTCGYHVETLCEGAYGKSPDLVIDGDTSALFTYIPSHIEYILNELLKNAFRATCEANPALSHSDLPPVTVTIAKAPSQSVGDGGVITLRIRDAGRGIPPDILPKVSSYAFTTVSGDEQDDADAAGTSGAAQVEEDHRDIGPYGVQNAGGGVGVHDLGGLHSNTGHLAGLGFGLPLSKLHCEYFGGSLELVSLYGHGTDAFVVLRGMQARAG